MSCQCPNLFVLPSALKYVSKKFILASSYRPSPIFLCTRSFLSPKFLASEKSKRYCTIYRNIRTLRCNYARWCEHNFFGSDLWLLDQKLEVVTLLKFDAKTTPRYQIFRKVSWIFFVKQWSTYYVDKHMFLSWF